VEGTKQKLVIARMNGIEQNVNVLPTFWSSLGSQTWNFVLFSFTFSHFIDEVLKYLYTALFITVAICL
jgi:hypothetical protein